MERLVDNVGDGSVRLEDWPFVRGFVLVKENSRPEGWILLYIHHHHNTTRDYRKQRRNIAEKTEMVHRCCS